MTSPARASCGDGRRLLWLAALLTSALGIVALHVLSLEHAPPDLAAATQDRAAAASTVAVGVSQLTEDDRGMSGHCAFAVAGVCVLALAIAGWRYWHGAAGGRSWPGRRGVCRRLPVPVVVGGLGPPRLAQFVILRI